MEDRFGFNKWAETYDDDVKNDTALFAKYEEVLDFVVEISDVKEGSTVLDIGTGTGNLMLKFARRGAYVIGLDPSKEMLRVARKKTKGMKNIELRLVNEPFLDIPYPDNYFDIVASTYAFHHVEFENKEKAIHEMLRVLKDGGKLVIGDLMFRNKDEESYFFAKYNFIDQDEFYERIDEIDAMFKKINQSINFKKFTDYTYVVWLRKLG